MTAKQNRHKPKAFFCSMRAITPWHEWALKHDAESALARLNPRACTPLDLKRLVDTGDWESLTVDGVLKRGPSAVAGNDLAGCIVQMNQHGAAIYGHAEQVKRVLPVPPDFGGRDPRPMLLLQLQDTSTTYKLMAVYNTKPSKSKAKETSFYLINRAGMDTLTKERIMHEMQQFEELLTQSRHAVGQYNMPIPIYRSKRAFKTADALRAKLKQDHESTCVDEKASLKRMYKCIDRHNAALRPKYGYMLAIKSAKGSCFAKRDRRSMKRAPRQMLHRNTFWVELIELKSNSDSARKIKQWVESEMSASDQRPIS